MITVTCDRCGKVIKELSGIYTGAYTVRYDGPQWRAYGEEERPYEWLFCSAACLRDWVTSPAQKDRR